MDPMTMMMISQMLGGMGGGGGQGGGDFGMGSLGAAFGSSLLGAHLNKKKARKEKHSLAKRVDKSINLTEALGGLGLNRQEAATRKATKEQLGGFDAARREVERLGQADRQGMLDREQQLGARLSQNMTNTGLGSSTIMGNAQRGLASDTNRGLQSISQGLAPEFANLALGRGQAQAAGTQRLGDLAAQRGQFQSQLGQMRMLGGQQLGQVAAPLSSGPGTLQMALPGMSQALGQYMGGQQQGGMDPQMLQWLFGGKPGGYGYGGPGGYGGGSPNMNLQTFTSGGQ